MDDIYRYDPDLDGEEAVVLTGVGGSFLRFYRPNRSEPGVLRCRVEVGGVGMRAALHDTVAYPFFWDVVAFLDDLGKIVAPWEGIRSWCSRDGALRVDAVFGTGGHIALTWAVGEPRSWSASITTEIEAGEQMRALATDLHHFLRP
ncbi:DUF6228 family protein [Streptoalloteichus hindustanus]|uniref:Uncharacterized protein n=1 Tax=Streptoalloteichus hindustanus TaxID=2017 RepID=A0A1M5AMB2_STRHI|nr:DUF6228 family protein [Streptoalloteichus hindustanus]SHF31052.1 hypothetical protein SAMN05444320_103175 [Streptoalloteichus hindustanus]